MFEGRNAASWVLADQMVRRTSGARVFETYPGGGQYDCLTVISPGLHIDINRRDRGRPRSGDLSSGRLSALTTGESPPGVKTERELRIPRLPFAPLPPIWRESQGW